MGFVNDLREWEMYEERIGMKLMEEFWMEFIKNPEKKGIDLIHPLMNIEVKYDKASKKTGNYFLEFQCNWVASWISKHKDERTPIFFGIGNEDEFLIFHNPHLNSLFMNWYEDDKYRVIENGWDWGRVKGMLIPQEDLREQALYIINLKENDYNL